MHISWHNDDHEHNRPINHYHYRRTRTIQIKSPKAFIWFGIVVILFVTIFGIIAYFSILNPANRDNYVEAQGVVVDNYDYYDYSNGEYLYSAIAEFEVDGEVYMVKDNASSSYPTIIGREVTILYNPENPRDAVFKSSNVAFVIVVIILFAFLISGISTIAIGVKKLRNGETLNTVSQSSQNNSSI